MISKPDLYLDELVSWYEEITGLSLSVRTMCRYILRLGLSRQRISVIAHERNDELRAQHVHFCSQFTRNMFIFIDESSCDDRTSVRRFGYFPIGHTQEGPRVRGNFVRRNRKTVVAGVDENGIVGSQVFDGSCTTELFNEAFEQEILPHLGSFADEEDRSIVVMDNCRIHDSDTLINMIRGKGAIIHYLPPYSPDFNPIETCFAVMKLSLKRYAGYAMQEPRESIYEALDEITPAHADTFFTRCGY